MSSTDPCDTLTLCVLAAPTSDHLLQSTMSNTIAALSQSGLRPAVLVGRNISHQPQSSSERPANPAPIITPTPRAATLNWLSSAATRVTDRNNRIAVLIFAPGNQLTGSMVLHASATHREYLSRADLLLAAAAMRPGTELVLISVASYVSPVVLRGAGAQILASVGHYRVSGTGRVWGSMACMRTWVERREIATVDEPVRRPLPWHMDVAKHFATLRDCEMADVLAVEVFYDDEHQQQPVKPLKRFKRTANVWWGRSLGRRALPTRFLLERYLEAVEDKVKPEAMGGQFLRAKVATLVKAHEDRRYKHVEGYGERPCVSTLLVLERSVNVVEACLFALVDAGLLEAPPVAFGASRIWDRAPREFGDNVRAVLKVMASRPAYRVLEDGDAQKTFAVKFQEAKEWLAVNIVTAAGTVLDEDREAFGEGMLEFVETFLSQHGVTDYYNPK